MAFAFVQANGTGHSGTSTSLAYGSNVAAGNLLVVVVSNFSTSTTVSISDTQGNVYAQAGTYSTASGANRVSIWYAMAKASGANTVTATPSSSDFTGLGVLEYSYSGATAFTVDGSVTNNGNTNPHSTGNIPVSGSGELAIAAFCQGSLTATWTPGTGFTNRVSQNNGSSFEALYVDDDFPVSSAVNDSGTSSSTSLTMAAIGASFKATTGGGGGGPWPWFFDEMSGGLQTLGMQC